MVQQPLVGQGFLSCGFTITLNDTNKRKNSSRRVISLKLRPLPENRQHSQETNFHAFGGIWTQNTGKRTAAEPRLRPRGHWHWLTVQIKFTKWVTGRITQSRRPQFEYPWPGQYWEKLDFYLVKYWPGALNNKVSNFIHFSPIFEVLVVNFKTYLSSRTKLFEIGVHSNS